MSIITLMVSESADIKVPIPIPKYQGRDLRTMKNGAALLLPQDKDFYESFKKQYSKKIQSGDILVFDGGQSGSTHSK